MRLVRHRGVWCGYIRHNGRSIRKSLGTKDRALAEQRVKDLEKQATGKNTTLNEIVTAYLEEKKKKPSYRSMADCWKPAKPFFGNLRPDQINRGLCRSYIQKRQSNDISNGSIRKELGIIRQAARWNDPSAPVVVELPPSPPPKERYLTKQEYKRLLDSCDRLYLKLFVQLALHTAGRKGAILELTWDRVDFEHNKIKLSTGKETNKGRATVYMNKTLKTALQDSKKDSLSEHVICHGGRGVKSIDKGFREAVKKAKLEGVTPHTLRHSAAVWMAEAGVPMPEIAQYLGHSNMNTTYKVYARFSPNHLRTAAAALEVI